MKKMLFCIFLACVLLCSCSQKEGKNEVAFSHGEGESIFFGSIAAVEGETVFLVGERDTGLIALFLEGLEITDETGKEMEKEELCGGMLVQVVYDGAIMESYPGRFSSPKQLSVIKQEDDIVGFYRQVIRDIYETDQVLNHGMYIAFDLSKVNYLSDAQKDALVYLAAIEFQKESLLGTVESLTEEGYIDGDNYVFEDGVLIKIEEQRGNKKGKFLFDILKWKSGKGAVLWKDCKASLDGEEYSYEIGDRGVS